MAASMTDPTPKKRRTSPKTKKQLEIAESPKMVMVMVPENSAIMQAIKNYGNEAPALEKEAQLNPEETLNSNAVKRRPTHTAKVTATTTLKRLYEPPAVPSTSKKFKNTDLVTLSSSTDSKVVPECNRPDMPTTSLESSPREKSSIPLTAAKETTKHLRLLQFDGKESTLRIWIDVLESIREEHGWDEATLIHNMKKNLEKVPLRWLIQEDDNISWADWKNRLMSKWRWTTGLERLDRLQSLVNIYRHPNENIMDFYYRKLNLGQHCELNDYIICQIIIQRLRNPYLEEGAYKAKCVDTDALLKYLEEYEYAGVNESKYHALQCTYCDRRGHTPQQCLGYCKYCKKQGHRSQVCRFKFNKR